MRKIKGLYFIEFDDGIKIGISNNIFSRLAIYLFPWCKTIRSVHVFECQNGRSIEQRYKERFKMNTLSNSTEFITGQPISKLLDLLNQFRLSNIPRERVANYKPGNLILVIDPYKRIVISRTYVQSTSILART